MLNDDRLEDFEAFVEEWLAPAHRHATLAYPFADTEAVILEVFGVVAHGVDLSPAPTVRAGLFRMVRSVALQSVPEVFEFKRRNAEAVAFALHDAASMLDGEGRLHVEATVAALVQLRVEQREVLRLVTLDDLDFGELGWILGVAAEVASEIACDAAEALRSQIRAAGETR